VSATNPDGLVDEEIRDTLYSGKIGFTYKPVEQGSLYLAYGSTVTPPGSANFNLSEATTSQENPNVDPQESRSLEAGIKWDVLDESLSLAAAVFRAENTNVLYNDDTTGAYYSDGGQVVEGVTLSATGQITDQWAVFANVTWLDASVDQPGDQYDGNWLVRTPEFSASLWTTYQVAEKWTIGGGVRYQGESMANSANTVTVPGYAVFDAMLQYEHSEHLTFRLNAYNLLDRDYISSINNNTQRLSKGEPASLMLTTQFSF
jgi:catecholate siderophore receptor